MAKKVENNVPLYDEAEVAKLDLLLKKFDACENHFALDTARSFLLILLNASNIFKWVSPLKTSRFLNLA